MNKQSLSKFNTIKASLTWAKEHPVEISILANTLKAVGAGIFVSGYFLDNVKLD